MEKLEDDSKSQARLGLKIYLYGVEKPLNKKRSILIPAHRTFIK